MDKSLEKSFAELKTAGLNTVDSLVNWLKQSNIIKSAKEDETKATKLFAGADPKNVSIEKFKEVIESLAKEQKTTEGELSKALAANASKSLEEMKAKAAVAGPKLAKAAEEGLKSLGIGEK